MTRVFTFFLFLMLGASLTYAQQFSNDRIYKTYLKIQEATEEGKFTEALEGINKLANYKTTPVETAAIQRARGFILLNLDREGEALKSFEKALAQNALNTRMDLELKYIAANLHAGEAVWQEAFKYYDTWLTESLAMVEKYRVSKNEEYNVPEPDVDAFRLGAAIAASMDNFSYAIDRAEDAIRVSKNPEKELFSLLVALHYQSQDMKKAISAIQRGLARFPDHDAFWKNLSSLYQLIKEDPSALAALVIAYEQDMLENQEEYMLLGRYFIYRGVPFDGASVVESGLECGVVEPTQSNLELLAQAWYAAREFDKSLAVLSTIVSRFGTIDSCLRAAQIMLEDEEYEAVLALLAKVDPGELPRNRGMYFKLKGYAEYGKSDYVNAITSFEAAAESDPELAESVQTWCAYIQDEFIK